MICWDLITCCCRQSGEPFWNYHCCQWIHTKNYVPVDNVPLVIRNSPRHQIHDPFSIYPSTIIRLVRPDNVQASLNSRQSIAQEWQGSLKSIVKLHLLRGRTMVEIQSLYDTNKLKTRKQSCLGGYSFNRDWKECKMVRKRGGRE